MSYIKCIQGHVDKGTINQQQADRIQKSYNNEVMRLTKLLGDQAAAEKVATKQAAGKANASKYANAKRLREAAAIITVRKEIDARYNKAKANYDKLNKTQKALLTAFGGKPSFSTSTRDFLDTVANHQENAINQIMQPLVKLIKKNPKYHDSKTFQDFMKEATGHVLGKPASTKEAREIGDSLKKSFDLSNKMYRAAGGVLGNIENYFPQSHNSDKFKNLVNKIGETKAFEEWRDFILPRLNLNKMIDEKTGLPFSPSDIEPVLRETFNTIRTDGLNKIHKMADENKQKMDGGNIREKSRFFHFKDADSFFEYNDKFGAGNENLFDVVMGDLGTMGRDIGTMQRMGPKPGSVMRNLNLKMAGDSPQSVWWTNGIYNTITGGLSAGNAEPHWYRVFNAIKNNNRASFLGSAVVSAVGDPFFGKLNAYMRGLPEYKMLENVGRLYREGGMNSESVNLFLTQTDYLQGASMSRFTEDPSEYSTRALAHLEKFTSRAAEWTHNMSGLNYWTSVQETVNAMATEGSTYLNRKTSWSKLNPAQRDLFEMHGMTKDDWDIVRNAKPKEFGKGKFIGVADVAASGDTVAIRKAAEKYGAYVRGFVDASVNKPTARVRGIQSFGLESGTIGRAVASSVMQFKGFGFTVMLNYAMPALQKAVHGNPSSLIYLIAGTAGVGAMAVQLKELVKGRDPRNMADGNFWKAAMMQGGGFGPLGDFFFSEHGRFGRSPLVDFMGPMFGQADDVRRMMWGNFERALDDSSYDYLNNFTTDAYKFATYNIPGQNLWYIRSQLRSLLEAPLSAIDPEYDYKQYLKEQKRIKEFGNESFIRPGEFLPQRAPDLGSAWQ